MNPRVRAHALAACILAALVQLAPAPAHASGAPSFDIDGDQVIGALLLGDAVVFGLIDIAFIAGGRPMPMWLSIVQVTWAGTLVPLLGVGHGTDSMQLMVGSAASAIWFSTHGVYDMTLYPAYRREKLRERERERARQRYRIALEPRAEGGMVHVYGAF